MAGKLNLGRSLYSIIKLPHTLRISLSDLVFELVYKILSIGEAMYEVVVITKNLSPLLAAADGSKPPKCVAG